MLDSQFSKNFDLGIYLPQGIDLQPDGTLDKQNTDTELNGIVIVSTGHDARDPKYQIVKYQTQDGVKEMPLPDYLSQKARMLTLAIVYPEHLTFEGYSHFIREEVDPYAQKLVDQNKGMDLRRVKIGHSLGGQLALNTEAAKQQGGTPHDPVLALHPASRDNLTPLSGALVSNFLGLRSAYTGDVNILGYRPRSIQKYQGNDSGQAHTTRLMTLGELRQLRTDRSRIIFQPGDIYTSKPIGETMDWAYYSLPLLDSSKHKPSDWEKIIEKEWNEVSY